MDVHMKADGPRKSSVRKLMDYAVVLTSTGILMDIRMKADRS